MLITGKVTSVEQTAALVFCAIGLAAMLCLIDLLMFLQVVGVLDAQ
jgi:hypothetical protein